MDDMREDELRFDRDIARKTRLEFLETELDVALTFVQVAATSYSMGHDEHGARAASKARDALAEVTKLLGDVPTSSQKEHLTQKLTELGEAAAKLPKATA